MSKTTTYFPTDPALRTALLDYRTKQGLTNASLGKLFDRGHTFMSKYIGDKLDFDPGDFAEKAWDMLKAIAGRLDLASQLFETPVSRAITGRIDMARRTSDVCLIHGPAGEGKTSSAMLYQRANASTIYWKACGRAAEHEDVQAGVFEALALREYDFRKTRWSVIVNALKGSQRVLIVDNAHRLSRSGLDWLFDLNEETGVAVILMGNPEILKRIRANDQQHSRIGVAGEATFGTKAAQRELPEIARRVTAQFSDEPFAEAVSDLAAFIATKPGRLRSVRKTTLLAFELLSKNGGDARSCFRTAHSSLVRDYALPSD